MTEVYIKYFFIVLCGFYLYVKILHLDIPFRQGLLTMSCALLMPVPIYYTQKYAPYLTISLIVLTSTLIAERNYGTRLSISLVTSAIALAFSYFAFSAASIMLSPFMFLLLSIMDNTHICYIITHALLGIIQLGLSSLPFRLSRLKNGMPFLMQKSSNKAGIAISIFILIAASFYNVYKINDILFILLIACTSICGLLLLIWWRRRLTNNYLEKLRTNEIQALENEIIELKAENDHLSKIIHKDNKLIPAMELAVREMLYSYPISNEIQHKKACELLQSLQNLSAERMGTLSSYEEQNAHLPLTSNVRLDALIKYMHQKSAAHHIHFDFTPNANINYMVECIIAEDDLSTLIADLTENAIIATKEKPQKNILLNIGIENQSYCLDVFDSGIPFEKDTISKLGKVRTTTHADTGGSGIGLMTAFEIIHQYHASFTINETINNQLYTKKVSISFDNQDQVSVIR